jgi:hypothetical protein
MELGQWDALYEMGAFTPEEFKPADQRKASGCFGGYIYLNASVARVVGVRIPGLTVEAIDAAFFGDYPDVPPYRPDPRDENAERTAAVGAWLKSLFTADPKMRSSTAGASSALVSGNCARRPIAPTPRSRCVCWIAPAVRRIRRRRRLARPR